MQPLISRNEPVEFRFKEQGAEYLVRFQDKPGLTYGVTVWKGGEAIDYREQFWGSRCRDNAKYILEQTLFELKTKCHDTSSQIG